MQIVSLFVGIAYQMVVWWKGSLNIFDGIVLISIYGGYLWIMRRLPPEEAETLDEIFSPVQVLGHGGEPGAPPGPHGHRDNPRKVDGQRGGREECPLPNLGYWLIHGHRHRAILEYR